MRKRLLLLLVLLTACAPAPTPPPLPTQTPVPSDTHIPPSPTKTATNTPTPSPTPIPTVRFAVVGDFGEANEATANVAALIDSWAVDLIITTGDNNPPLGEARTMDVNVGQFFHAYIHPYTGEYGPGAETNRFFPALGNHDWYLGDVQAHVDYFTLPGNERYYDFQWDFIHFFVLSSDWWEPDGIGRKSPQAEWLKGKLAASTAPWKVVYFHHSPYTSGYHGDTVHMQWPFKEWGADVVLSGHDHIYERLEIDGLTYFVNGLGGSARYAINAPRAGSQIRYRAKYGAMLVNATPTEMAFQFINVEGEVIDSFKLEK